MLEAGKVVKVNACDEVKDDELLFVCAYGCTASYSTDILGERCGADGCMCSISE